MSFLKTSAALLAAITLTAGHGAAAAEKQQPKAVNAILQISAYSIRTEAPAKWYTEEEQEMMGWIIQQEVRGGSLEHKRAVAEVILNRVKSPAFPDTIREVLLAPGQFTSAQNWYNRTYPPDEDTLQAVEEVLSGTLKPVTGGAVFFYAPRWADENSANWFESLPLTLEMEGHRFFSLK